MVKEEEEVEEERGGLEEGGGEGEEGEEGEGEGEEGGGGFPTVVSLTRLRVFFNLLSSFMTDFAEALRRGGRELSCPLLSINCLITPISSFSWFCSEESPSFKSLRWLGSFDLRASSRKYCKASFAFFSSILEQR